MERIWKFKGRVRWFAVFTLLIACGYSLPCIHCQAEEASSRPAAVPVNPTAEWAEIEKGMSTLFPPPAWRQQKPSPEEVEKFQKKLVANAKTLAEKSQAFLKSYPTNENAGDTRFTVVFALSHAVAAGDMESEKRARQFVETTLADASLSEDERARVLLMASNIDLMKKLGMKFFVEGQPKFHEEMDQTMVDGLRKARKRFPKSAFIYTGLLGVAERSKPAMQKELATEIVDAEAAPPAVRANARHLLNGTKPYEVGKPLDIQFKALDGREVDLARLKGKVVLVEFWATDCGPCVAEMPEVKKVYQKFHDQGFEIVAISLDDKASALREFIKEKELPWPQHFDGKGWENRFAMQYGIFSIPTMWLVDRSGNLRISNARGNLEGRVEELLAEKP
jgi:peroxiredoxin